MDILSQKTVTILRDEKVSRAMDELLDPNREGNTRTVELTNPTRNEGQVAIVQKIRIRRIA